MQKNKIEKNLLLLSQGVENVVEFSLSIEGTVSSNFLKPRVRLVVEKEDGKISWLFPTEKTQSKNYKANVKIDPQQQKTQIFCRTYVEVILENYYFVPVEILTKVVNNEKIEEKDNVFSEVEQKREMVEEEEVFVRNFKHKYLTEAQPSVLINRNKPGVRVISGPIVVNKKAL